MWTIFKVFIEFVGNIVSVFWVFFFCFFFFCFKACGILLLIRDQTHTPCVGKPSLNH